MDRPFPEVFLVVDSLAIEKLLGPTLITERILAVISEEQSATVHDDNSVAIIEQRSSHANSILGAIGAGKQTSGTQQTTNHGTNNLIQYTIVRNPRKLVLEPQSVASVMVLMKVKGLLYTDRGYRLPTKRIPEQQKTWEKPYQATVFSFPQYTHENTKSGQIKDFRTS